MNSKPTPDISMLRTAAGSAPAVSQCAYFQRLGARIIAADSNPLSVGLFTADRGCCVPRANAPEYIDALLEICKVEKVNAFLPALDEELLKVHSATNRFEQVGTMVLLSGQETLEICSDKWKLYEFFSKHNFPTVPTRKAADARRSADQIGLPQLIKPRRGRGSTDIYVARTPPELKFFIEYVEDPVVQRFIKGSEYTIDVLADWNSEAVVIAPRRRIAAESGISYKGQLVWNTEMVAMVERVVSSLKLVGPANIQCFIDEKGELLFTEVNARLAGSSILTAAAGVPLYQGILDMICGRTPAKCIHAPQDLVMLRYWAELYLSTDKASSFGWKP
ncbi:MAG: ATP-grasp domain-containing protein [Acidobacteriaceae bacterium]|nr:ATP-grasp domain-containing protein [Acidobacteriaceae bacterium]MBV9782140.1 ATP-grasp domain-containing protein [Acidobacteriaceae bacterium]